MNAAKADIIKGALDFFFDNEHRADNISIMYDMTASLPYVLCYAIKLPDTLFDEFGTCTPDGFYDMETVPTRQCPMFTIKPNNIKWAGIGTINHLDDKEDDEFNPLSYSISFTSEIIEPNDLEGILAVTIDYSTSLYTDEYEHTVKEYELIVHVTITLDLNGQYQLESMFITYFDKYTRQWMKFPTRENGEWIFPVSGSQTKRAIKN